MSASASHAHGALEGLDPDHHVEPEQKVTPLELFFDLVFVFAITQVTAFLAADPTFDQLARGLLLIGALWWCWVGYAWLTDALASDEGVARVSIFAAMAAILVTALAVPGAFDDDSVVFGVAYAIARLLQITTLYAARRDEPQTLAAIRRLTITSLLGPGLILVSTGFDAGTQGAIFAAALAVDYAGGWLATRGEGEWYVHAGHFAERHALIVIIALGESIVALGVGAEDVDIATAGVLAAAVAGIALAAAQWWAYFDVVAIVAERRLAQAQGAERGELARDSYSYLHLLMVAGIILVALGVKKTLGDFDKPLKDMPAVCLCGGAALYYLGHIGFRLRNVRTLSRSRTAGALVLLALIPVATEVDALVALLLVTLVCVAVVAYEAVRYAEARDRIRHALGA